MNKKTTLTNQENIQKSNEAFELLSPAQKRVQIAKDVLAQLDLNGKSRKIHIVAGEYFSTEFNNEELLKDDEVELQNIVTQPEFQCNVCAKGALFVTKALNYNNCSVKSDLENIFSDDIVMALSGIFDTEMLDNIENAFECGVICNLDDDYYAVASSIMYSDIENPEDRLRLIMENIIANKGDFKIPRLKELTDEQITLFREAGDYFFLKNLDKNELLDAVKNKFSNLDSLDTEKLSLIFKTIVDW